MLELKMDDGARKPHILVLLLCVTGQHYVAKASYSVEENSDLRKTTKVISNCCAVLVKDPRANFPSSFTICSTIMAPYISDTGVLPFFSISERAYVSSISSNYELAFDAHMRIESTNEGPAITVNWEQQWKDLE